MKLVVVCLYCRFRLIYCDVIGLNVVVLLFFYCVVFILLDWLILVGKEKKWKFIK